MISHPCIKPPSLAWIFSISAAGTSQAAVLNCSPLILRDAAPGLLETKAPRTVPVQRLPPCVASACGAAQSGRTRSKGELHLLHSLCCERGEVVSAATLEYVGRGQRQSNWMGEERLLTNKLLQWFSLKVTLTALHIIWASLLKMSLHTHHKKNQSITPNCSAVLSSATFMTITHSIALMLFLFVFFVFKWQLLSVSFFWLFTLFFLSSFFLACHLLALSCEFCTWSQLTLLGKFKGKET